MRLRPLDPQERTSALPSAFGKETCSVFLIWQSRGTGLGACLAFSVLIVNSEFQVDRYLLRDLYINIVRGEVEV